MRGVGRLQNADFQNCRRYIVLLQGGPEKNPKKKISPTRVQKETPQMLGGFILDPSPKWVGGNLGVHWGPEKYPPKPKIQPYRCTAVYCVVRVQVYTAVRPVGG